MHRHRVLISNIHIEAHAEWHYTSPKFFGRLGKKKLKNMYVSTEQSKKNKLA
jgi:hypothetical protein